MRSKLWALGWALVLATPAVLADERGDAPRVRNGTDPAYGTRRIELQEQWRAGGEDHLFGRIRRVLVGPADTLYVLDYQLAQVHVFAPDGRFVRWLSREGDGPGEIRHPNDMFFLPDGTLGLIQFYPGKVILLDTAGTPCGTLPLGGEKDSRLLVLRDAGCRGGTLACCGQELLLGANSLQGRCRFLATFGRDGREISRLDSRITRGTYAERGYIERNEYSLEGRWTLGPEGCIYTAPERDRYEVHVHRPDGTLERVIEREYTPWKRSAEEKQQVADGIVLLADGVPIEVDMEISDYAPCLSSLHVTDGGDLWVGHSRSARNLPAGVVRVLDLFDGSGRYVERLEIAWEGSTPDDRLLAIDEHRFMLIRSSDDALEIIFLAAGAPSR